jgi:hypothetical protein
VLRALTDLIPRSTIEVSLGCKQISVTKLQASLPLAAAWEAYHLWEVLLTGSIFLSLYFIPTLLSLLLLW